VPKISEARREERRGEILDAALRSLAKTGYQRTSMTDIIQESGLSAGAIYSYFASKQELVRAVAGRVLEERRVELEVASRDRILTPAQIVSTIIAGVRANAPLPVLMQVWAEASVDPELRAMVQDVLGRLRAVITADLERWALANPQRVPGDAAAWASASTPVLVGMIPGFVLQSILIDGFDQDAYIAAIPGFLDA
jgi:TetR/AcrR family transcriptional regulator, transcriptional repressor of aconitase